MSWRDTLRPASFRGVPFEVEGADLATGRRVAVHEYPQKDKPFAEDMGRKAREFSITAFVIGDDYMDKRDALLAALEEEGSGELVHTYYGTMQVVATSTRVREDFKEGRMARFDLAFVESGDKTFPSSTVSTGDQVKDSASTVISQLSGLFAQRYSVNSLPDWARRVAGDDVADMLSTAQGLVAQADSSGSWLAQFDETTKSATAQTSSPAVLAKTVSTALTKPESLVTGNDLGAVTRWAASGDAGLAAQSTTTATDAVNAQVAQNEAALRELARGNLLAQGAAALADTDVTVYQDAMAARKAITGAIDAEMMVTTSDEAYQAWSDLRSKVHSDLTARSQKAARLRNITVPETTPSLALSYDLYEDARRDGEIVARNAIRHPSFVPPEPVKVLSV